MELKVQAFNPDGKMVSNILFYAPEELWFERVIEHIEDLLEYEKTDRLKNCKWFVNGEEFISEVFEIVIILQ